MTLNALLSAIEEDASFDLAEQAREYPEGVAASLDVLADEEEERAERVASRYPALAEQDIERAKRLRGYAVELRRIAHEREAA